MPGPPRSRTWLWVLGVAGAILVLGGVAFMVFISVRQARRTMSELGAEPPVRMGPEKVAELLAGPKKDFVGRWSSVAGGLQIEASGRASYGSKIGFTRESANGAIPYFGDDAFFIGSFRFAIETPPHRDGSAWKMRVRGQNFER